MDMNLNLSKPQEIVEEPGTLQSMESQSVRLDWKNLARTHAHTFEK